MKFAKNFHFKFMINAQYRKETKPEKDRNLKRQNGGELAELIKWYVERERERERERGEQL